MRSGIIEVQKRCLGGHFPKSAFALWRIQITNCMFSQFSLIILIIPHPTHIAIRHEVLELAHKGMRQSAIAGCVGLTHVTINHILWRHAATVTLVPGKSTGAPQKTTTRRDHALLRMVQQGHFINHRPTRKPLFTANHHPLCLEWARRWQNLTMAHWQHVIFGDEPRFQLHSVDSSLRLCRLLGECFQQRCRAFRLQTGGGSIHVWGAFHSGDKLLLLLPNRYLTDELYRSILWDTLMPFAREHFGDNYSYQDDNVTPHHARIFFHLL